MRLDINNLRVETDDAGFIWGKSVWGDTMGSEASAWMDRTGQLASVSIDRSVNVSKGIQFTPVTSVLAVTTTVNGLRNSVGKRIRVKWKNQVIFTGTIDRTDFSAKADNAGPEELVTVSAIGITKVFMDQFLYDLEAPEQTAGNRAMSVFPVFSDVNLYGIEVINCQRLMAARGKSTVKLMTVLQETADTQLARFYINRNDKLVMDGNAAPDPVIFFSDDPAVAGRTDYDSVEMSKSADNAISAVGVMTKQSLTNAEGKEYQLSAQARHQSSVIVHEETYEVDVPLRQNEVVAWAQSFPLLGYAPEYPAQLTCSWQDSLANLELTHLVSIQYKGDTYLCGVKGIRYDIQATQRGMNWAVQLDLMPGHLVRYTPVLAPSEVLRFTANAVTDHSIGMSWTQPDLPNGLTGYTIRFKEGPTAPTSMTDGTLLVELDDDQVSYSHQGIKSGTQYSYTIWATTSNAAIRSNPVTTGATTPETIPSAVQGFSAVRTSATGNTFTWSAPAAPGTDIAGYEIRYRSDGVDPTPTTGSLLVNLPVGTTQHVGSGYNRNVTWNWGVFPKTNGGKYGPGAFAVQNTNETIPTAVGNLAVYADNYQSITAYWSPSSNTEDLNHYRFVRLENAYRAPESWDNPQYGLGTDRTSLNLQPVSMNTHHDVAIFPITHGGLVGPRANAWTDTPQGIFSRVFDAEAAWAQSYRANGAPSSLSSGSAQNLYYGYGDSFNGNQRSMVGWNVPGDIQNCYSVDRVIMRIYNLHAYNNSGADCDFGVHGYGGAPGTWPGGATGLARYRMAKPGWLDVDVTGWAAGHFRNGGRGFFLGPAPSNANAYYGYASGTAGSGPRPTLRIEYRTIG